MIYDFFIYAGARNAGTESCGAQDVVLRLVEGVPKNKNFRIFFDNWFSMLSLLWHSRYWKFRSNGIGGCPLMSKKDLKKEGGGSYNYRTDQNTGTHLLKWFDSKCVLLGSTYSGVKVSSTLQRFDLKQKKQVDVQCPDMIKDYNGSMGGVDLADMLIELYRTKISTKKRWYLKLISHCLDIAKVNAWLLYRRHCLQLNFASRRCLLLRRFTAPIAESLQLQNKDPERKPGRPKRSISPTSHVCQKPSMPAPIPSVRYDSTSHWPEIDGNRSRCRRCDMTCTVKCSKCGVQLCLNKDRNCFKDYHTL